MLVTTKDGERNQDFEGSQGERKNKWHHFCNIGHFFRHPDQISAFVYLPRK